MNSASAGSRSAREDRAGIAAHDSPRTRQRLFVDTGRAAGGALIFSLPMMMTQEMWQFGFVMQSGRLALFVALTLPLLMELSRQIGLKHSLDWRHNLLEALMACGVAAAVSTVTLLVFGLLDLSMSAREIVGKLALQMVPAAVGALLARSQFGASVQDKLGDKKETYWGELFLMGIGALFLGFNIAPTEEVVLISVRMSEWHAIALLLLSLLLMHAFVFAVGFKGGSELEPDTPWWSAFLRFTLPGYAISLLICLYVLWSFGRTDAQSPSEIAMIVIVLGLPSSAGAAAARLIL